MRRLGLIDILVVALLVAALVYVARSDFGRFANRGYFAPTPTAAPAPVPAARP